MVVGRPAVLQLNRFSEYLEAGLDARFERIRWFELDASAQAAWLAARAADVQAVVAGGQVGCPTELMTALPSLAIVAINGVGVDKVDLAVARARGVRVGTTRGALTDDVADLAVGLTIALLRQISSADTYVREGRWPEGDRPLAHTVSGRRFGIVGMGDIGTALAARLTAFGAVAYTGPHPKRVPYPYYPELIALARACDVLLLCCPANPSTRHMIDASVIDALGPQGYLVNVARGSLIDEDELAAALTSGRLAGAALDVFEDEPRVPHALRASAHVVLTPHVASATVEARRRMADLVLANIDACLAGTELPSAAL